MKHIWLKIIPIAATIIGFEATAHAVTLEQARRLQQVISDSQQKVAFLIQQGEGRGGGRVDENDPVAKVHLLSSSAALNTASVSANDLASKLQVNPADPTIFQVFIETCTYSAIARSRVAQARLAAIQPPPGIYNAFTQIFLDVISALDGLRSPAPNGAGCP